MHTQNYTCKCVALLELHGKCLSIASCLPCNSLVANTPVLTIAIQVQSFEFTVHHTGVSPILLTSLSAHLVAAMDTDHVVQVAAVVSALSAVSESIILKWNGMGVI